MGVSLKATRIARMLKVACAPSGARATSPGTSGLGSLRRAVENPSRGPAVPRFPGTGGTGSAPMAIEPVTRVAMESARRRECRTARGRTHRV